MKCFICDAGLSEVHYNSDHDDFEPCSHCLSVIQDTLDGFLDNAYVSDDELPDGDPILAAYQASLAEEFPD